MCLLVSISKALSSSREGIAVELYRLDCEHTGTYCISRIPYIRK